MKKLFILLAVLGTMFAQETFAQDVNTAVRKKGVVKAAVTPVSLSAQQRAAFTTGKMAMALSLSDNQTATVHRINMETAERNETLLKDYNSIEALRSSLRSLNLERESKIKAVLTPAQVLEYERNKARLQDLKE